MEHGEEMGLDKEKGPSKAYGLRKSTGMSEGWSTATGNGFGMAHGLFGFRRGSAERWNLVERRGCNENRSLAKTRGSEESRSAAERRGLAERSGLGGA